MAEREVAEKTAEGQEGGYAEEEGLYDKLFNCWWGKILVGLVCMWAAWSTYSKLQALESGEIKETSLWKPLALVYDVVGMWGVVVIVCLIALTAFGWGIKQLVSGKE